MALTTTLSAQVGISSACRSLTLSRATFYRSQQPPSATPDVKQVGLSYGSACRYASGVALDGTVPGNFQLWSFSILP